jgi:hypothetical protein
MLRINGKAVSYGEIWFDEEAPADPGVDILVYRQRPAPPPGDSCRPFLSMTNDLGGTESDVMEPYSNTCRYQIRRAETRDALRLEFITEPGDRLDEFCEYFDIFAKQKAIDPAHRPWLEEACRAGQLVLSAARCGDEALVWHAHNIGSGIARLEHSASSFREGDIDYRNLVGRANRWLHWQDMLKFKALGATQYDWGGMFEDESTPERAGINNFKRQFGGRTVHRYDYSLPVSAWGRVYLPLRDAWRRWSRPAQPAAAPATA